MLYVLNENLTGPACTTLHWSTLCIALHTEPSSAEAPQYDAGAELGCVRAGVSTYFIGSLFIILDSLRAIQKADAQAAFFYFSALP